MDLPKCPCGGNAICHETYYENDPHIGFSYECKACGARAFEGQTAYDAERAWCRMVAAEAMEKALEFYADRVRTLTEALDTLLARVDAMPNPHANPMRHYYNMLAVWKDEARAALRAARGEERDG